MTGFLPVWAQAAATFVAIVGGLGLLYRISRGLHQVVEIIPVVTLIADHFELPADNPHTKTDPQRVLPVLLQIADEFKPNAGNTLSDRIDKIDISIKRIESILENLTHERH